MCFSASASFTAGVLLTFVGTETVRKVHKPSQLALAGIPIFFAFQQFAEGVLWLTIGDADHAGLQNFATHLFLIMAQVVWPILIPISVLLLEKNRKRKFILSALLSVGVVVGLYYSYRLITVPVHPEIIGKHVVYQDTTLDAWGLVSIILYLAATLFSFFVSSMRKVYVMGIIMSVSFAVSALFYIRCLTSVWCFFAAVMSLVVFYMIRDAHKKFHLPAAPIAKAPAAA